MRVILRLLAWLILAYRRWLSGKGPLRSVRCSFAGGESCSAFGLRATAEAGSAREAIGRILRRLRRCRDACLIGDGRTLSWTPLHDLPAEQIAAEMRRDGERDPAIERMLVTRRAVAFWRAERFPVRVLSNGFPARVLAGIAAKPVVCSHAATQARGRRRIAGFVALAAVAAFAIAFKPVLGACALLAAALASANAAHASASCGARFALHAAMSGRWAQLRPRPVHLRASEA